MYPCSDADVQAQFQIVRGQPFEFRLEAVGVGARDVLRDDRHGIHTDRWIDEVRQISMSSQSVWNNDASSRTRPEAVRAKPTS